MDFDRDHRNKKSFDTRMVGDSSFIADSLATQKVSSSWRGNEPSRRRKRRWVLHFFLASGLFLCLGTSALTLVDQVWRKTKRKLLSFLPDGMEGKVYQAIAAHNDSYKSLSKQEECRKSCDIQRFKLENEDEYRQFLTSLELKFITPEDVIRPHRNICNGVRNALPPEKYWSRIKDSLKAADAICGELGVPLRMINSAYRSPNYNAECKGAVANSYHTMNMALDLVFACSPRQAAQAAKILRSKGTFKGGLGVYDSFIHIDSRGRNADWGISV